jgi:hypothetical protein
MSKKECEETCKPNPGRTWACIDDGCAMGFDGTGYRVNPRCIECPPGADCEYKSKTRCETECNALAGGCGGGQPGEPLPAGGGLVPSGAAQRSGYGLISASPSIAGGFGFRPSGGAAKCGCNLGFAWKKGGDHACGCDGGYAGMRDSLPRVGQGFASRALVSRNVMAAPSAQSAAGSGKILASAAPRSECSGASCCCEPQQLCIKSRGQTRIRKSILTIGLGHRFEVDARWKVRKQGDASSLASDEIDFCNMEWWEAGVFALPPAGYKQWTNGQWNAAHDPTAGVGGYESLPWSWKQSQIDACRKNWTPKKYTQVDNPGTGLLNAILLQENAVILVRVNPGCRDVDPVCMLLEVDYRVGATVIRGHGPKQSPACAKIPDVKVAGGRIDFDAMIQDLRLGSRHGRAKWVLRTGHGYLHDPVTERLTDEECSS